VWEGLVIESLLHSLAHSLSVLIHNLKFQLASIIIIATVHGYAAAWLAIRMLFRPHNPVKLLGLTVWPQGMIPRHRDRLAESIGKAVGNELVSQETIVSALFEADFFRRKVETFVGSYTEELLGTSYPSFIEALPSGARAPVLDTITALQLRVADYINELLRSEETADALARFVDRRVDDLLAKRVHETISDESINRILGFIEERFRGLMTESSFKSKIGEFVSARVDEIAGSTASLAELFTPDTVALIKARIDAEVPPIVQHLAELATSPTTRTQIGGLIKREVDDYYQELSFFKKIFVSRERIHREVDEMVNKTMPRRVEEFLHGEAFEQQAEVFLNSAIDDLLQRPINAIIGIIEPDKLESIKEQVTNRLLALAQSPELSTSVSAYTTDAFHRLRPHTLRALLEHLNPNSAPRLKSLISKGLLTVLTREETARTINAVLSAQVERLLVTPIGRLADHMSPQSIENASLALTERITDAARERLPAAIAEFDVGGIVRKKVTEFPVQKLEDLVLSIAAQHLKKIEMFGAIIGLFIGIFQALYFWFFANARH
jgi:uncharacterized membrane protein YheB (UPF0754 family)